MVDCFANAWNLPETKISIFEIQAQLVFHKLLSRNFCLEDGK